MGLNHGPVGQPNFHPDRLAPSVSLSSGAVAARRVLLMVTVTPGARRAQAARGAVWRGVARLRPAQRFAC